MEPHGFQDKIQPNPYFYISYEGKELGKDEIKPPYHTTHSLTWPIPTGI